jgi:hypothetical protein
MVPSAYEAMENRRWVEAGAVAATGGVELTFMGRGGGGDDFFRRT